MTFGTSMRGAFAQASICLANATLSLPLRVQRNGVINQGAQPQPSL
jgi:hypothetical protein